MVLSDGCSRSADPAGVVVPRNPQQAASQLEQAFANAPPDTKRNADVASDATRNGDYEKAAATLQVIRSGQNITVEQGIAIHDSAVIMETRIVAAMEAGDEKARRAYALLKALNRN